CGFGAAAHIVAQVAKYQQREIYAFTRPTDEEAKKFALDLGAVWAGGSNELPPKKLDAAIIFAPAGELVPQALKAVGKGGTVVCGGIHMSDVPSFPYAILWEERSICSVANLTRRDGEEFMALAPQVPVRTEGETFPLEDANATLNRLRTGKIRGAAVFVTGQTSAQRSYEGIMPRRRKTPVHCKPFKVRHSGMLLAGGETLTGPPTKTYLPALRGYFN